MAQRAAGSRELNIFLVVGTPARDNGGSFGLNSLKRILHLLPKPGGGGGEVDPEFSPEES
jgi:hypothetical protein